MFALPKRDSPGAYHVRPNIHRPSITLPASGWRPRPHQMGLWGYLERGGRRAVQIAHRRWGKDDVALHWAALAAHQKIGTYWHMLPEYAQGRKAIWDAVNPHTGKRRIDEAFPKELRTSTREQEMFIRFKNGSSWQVVGSDNYKDLVGTPPVGLVLSEWAKAHPAAWAYLAPVLVENGGWALAITTPEGRNHAHSMFRNWGKNPAYWAERQTIEDSVRMCIAGGVQPSVTLEDVEVQRGEYHEMFGEDAGDALIQQEWFCSFEAAVLGAYFGKALELAETEGRICKVDRVPHYPVSTAWDIGVDDPMAIWVFQAGPGFLHVIDYIEGSNEGFDFYCDWLEERGYVGGVDYVPHDAKQRMPTAQGTRTRIQELFSLKRRPHCVGNHKLMDQVNAGRRMIRRVRFDAERCKRGLDVLRAYKQDWDPIGRTFRKTPKHDWSSHGSSAWCTLAMGVTIPDVREDKAKQTKVEAPAITVNDLLNMSKPDRVWA